MGHNRTMGTRQLQAPDAEDALVTPENPPDLVELHPLRPSILVRALRGLHEILKGTCRWMGPAEILQQGLALLSRCHKQVVHDWF
ncbi:hypothetical protein LB503_008175 [Fusarium chuoi]|nr:hypothetical protein LB503_008175 [Fusarium chuoi]